MSNKVNIEGKHLRWFIAGALREYYANTGTNVSNEQFQYNLSDTCNRVHKYLTEGKGLDGTASDIQCVIGVDARAAFGVKDDAGEVTIFW